MVSQNAHIQPSDAQGSTLNATGLGRDIRLLELLASDASHQRGGLGVTELAQHTGRSKTVISRALATLANAGLAARNPETGRYRVGPRVFALAAKSAEAQLVHSARPFLRGLVDASHETSHLCVLHHGNVLTLASEMGKHAIRSAGWEGVTTAAWRSSSGWVLLSDWDQESLERWYSVHGDDAPVLDEEVFSREESPFVLLENPLPSNQKLRNFATLQAEISRVQRQGYAVLDEDLERGIVGVSAPIYDHTGAITAAFNVSGPKERLGNQIEALTRIVCQAAQRLSLSLGATASHIRSATR